MSTQQAQPSFAFLGLLVAGGGFGFGLYMLTQPGTVSGLVAAVQADLHLVAVTLAVIGFGVTMALYARE